MAQSHVISRQLRKVVRIFTERFDNRPISDVAALTRFARTRASYVAQTSLYGYLKTRMGTSFVRHFEDEEFSLVIRTAAAKLFASCLADLTIFAVATAAQASRMSPADAAELAKHCFIEGMAEGLGAAQAATTPAAVYEQFASRVAGTVWANAAIGEAAFIASPADLVRFAPVIDEYKELDREIVTNSIRFRWRDVREQFRKRVDGASIAADWTRTGAA